MINPLESFFFLLFSSFQSLIIFKPCLFNFFKKRVLQDHQLNNVMIIKVFFFLFYKKQKKKLINLSKLTIISFFLLPIFKKKNLPLKNSKPKIKLFFFLFTKSAPSHSCLSFLSKKTTFGTFFIHNSMSKRY